MSDPTNSIHNEPPPPQGCVVGDGFIMTAPSSAKDRVFMAAMRHLNALFQEMVTAPENGTTQAIKALLQYMKDYDLEVEDIEFLKNPTTQASDEAEGM